MIIQSVELVNFGPYYGRHVLELGRGGHPVVVIEGLNMAGKTSILNSIRWALYREAKGRDARPMKTGDLVNAQAIVEDDARMSVKLNVVVDGREITLLRQVTARAGVANPLNDEDFEWYVSVAVDGAYYEPSEYDLLVEDLLPRGISRFFLFDGELLNEYEALVREGGEAGARGVRESIEMILGLPAARRARVDVQALKEEVSKRLQRANTKDKKYRAAADQLAAHEAKRDQLERDRDEVVAQIKADEDALRGFDANLLRYQETREDVGRLKQAKEDLERLEATTSEKIERRRELAKDLWRDVLAPRLRQETTRLEQERDRLTADIARLSNLCAQQAKLQEDLTRDLCSQCGRGLEEPERARLRSELKNLQTEISEVEKTADAERFQTLAGILRQLRRVAPAGITSAVKDIEADLARLDLDTYKANEHIEAAERKLRGIKIEQVIEWDRETARLNERLTGLRASVKKLNEELVDINAKIGAETKKLLDNENPASQRLAREHDTLEVLEDLTARAVAEMTDELRADVEREATDIFLELTTDKTFQGLRINEQYGLTIVQANGEDLRVRSAGAEQVVALSLLGALNRLATKRGPVIMDTPFGRLDQLHRANILQFLPRMADQVVLLIHNGEVDTERDLDPIKDQISARYEITRDGPHSQLEVARTELNV